MECDDPTSLSLDQIIQIKNIQAPPCTSSMAMRLSRPFVRRGRGFARPTKPRDSGPATSNVSKELLASAYRAGMAAAFRQHSLGAQRGWVNRRGLLPGRFQRGGMQRAGFQRTGVQQMVQRGSTGLLPTPMPEDQEMMIQLPIPGISRAPSHPKEELESIQIMIRHEDRPPLQDRLGWYPWQQLTPAQQVARNKLSLAKMRLNNQRNQGFQPRAYNAGLLHGRRGRMNAARGQGRGPQPQWTSLPIGVSPLLQHNVARLPGGGARNSGQSVKSFSAISQRSGKSSGSRFINQMNCRANKCYLAERQFENNATLSMSSAALQERMLPKVPWGSFNRPGKHNIHLDARLQKEIAEVQQQSATVNHELMEDYEYSATVAATQTTSSDRFSLMMGLAKHHPRPT